MKTLSVTKSDGSYSVKLWLSWKTLSYNTSNFTRVLQIFPSLAPLSYNKFLQRFSHEMVEDSQKVSDRRVFSSVAWNVRRCWHVFTVKMYHFAIDGGGLPFPHHKG